MALQLCCRKECNISATSVVQNICRMQHLQSATILQNMFRRNLHNAHLMQTTFVGVLHVAQIYTMTTNDPKQAVQFLHTVLGTGAPKRGACPGPCVLAPDGLDPIDLDSIDLGPD